MTNIKIIYEHALNRSWTLYFDTFQLHNSFRDEMIYDTWVDNIDSVYEFDSVEKFWRLYNNINKPGEMWQKSSYYLFQNKPILGGDILLNITDTNVEDINRIWLHLVLALVGETIVNSNKIQGISLKCNKKYYTMEIYMCKQDKQDKQDLYKKNIEAYIYDNILL